MRHAPFLPPSAFRRGGLAVRVLLRVLLFSTVVTLVLTAIQLYLEFRGDVERLEQRLDAIERSHVGSLGQSLWALDEAQLRSQVEGILLVPDVRWVEVREADAFHTPLVVAAGERQEGQRLQREIPVFCLCGEGQRLVGFLAIEATLADIYRSLLNRVAAIFVGMGTKALLVGLFAFFLMHRMVTRHLVAIAAATRGLDPLRQAAPLVLQRRPPPVEDELDTVVAALNSRNDELRHSFEDLRAAKKAVERRQLQLAESERRYRELIEAVPVGVFEDDGAGGNTYVNQAWLALAGIEREQAVGAGWWSVIHPQDRDRLMVAWEAFQRSGKREDSGVEFRVQRPDGKESWVLAQVVARTAPDGRIAGYLGSWTDLTEVRRLEEERRRIERRLQETQKLEALGQLAGGVAHDFNNILGAIQGFAQFVVEDAEPQSPAREHGRRILAASRRGKALVEQILAFARRGEIERSRVEPTVLAREIAALLRTSLPASVAFTIVDAAPGAAIEADAGQLGQVLMNLCLNARDAMEGRRGRIEVTIRPTDPAGEAFRRLASQADGRDALAVESWSDAAGVAWAALGRVESGRPYLSLVVSDQGEGMDKTLLARVFEPFFTTKGKGRGTGLGLAVVQGIVLAHDGLLLVHSRPGEGTAFEVALPLAPSSATEAADTVASAAAAGAAGRKVLLVDDDADFGAMLLTALERRGFAAEQCTSPSEALVRLQRPDAAFEALVTDFTMPGMSGLELIEAIRARHPALPCVLCTGYAEDLTDEEARAAGAATLLRKPIDIEALVRLLSPAGVGDGRRDGG